ncbi:hypothetical protein HYALB_00003142 [Hymenoscyphus albidus]|uniref:AMP-dependent synthetase/ligase domain-containing protein n=1 Tax=Hymenoscyphus albidus TaxID=595503 RepID=A0A9N9LAI9_9HELO|nr:hypothetical protein HYALB_00003142 [Hymenoscyphus albidus]
MPTLQFSEGLSPPQPILQRKQLLNHIIDGFAQTRPESVWAKVPKNSTSYNAGYRKITYKLMANAVNGLAWWIKRELGESKTFETLAYFGNWDPRYCILMLAAVKAGYKVDFERFRHFGLTNGKQMIFPSPTYAIAGVTRLLDRVDCKCILMSSGQLDIIKKLSQHTGRQLYSIPSFETLLNEEYPHYPFDKTFESAREEPLVMVHTSGTTGMPKPLIYTHDWVATWVEQCQTSPIEGHMSLESICFGIEICAVGPPNHSSNFYPNIFAAIPNQIVVIFPLPEASFTFETAMEMIRGNDPYLLLAPAHILDGIASDKKYIEEVPSKVKWIAFGGGPLSKPTGAILTECFQLFGMYGTSEMGTVPKIVPTGPWNRRSWNSWKPHSIRNMSFRQIQGGDSYEAWITKNKEAEEEQPVLKMFPELNEWSTRDMFTADPHREGFWSYQG